MSKKPNTFKEEFSRFFEEPSRDKLRDLLKNHYGELPELEFKSEWPETGKVVKLVLGMANSGGGCIVFGICENANNQFECNGLAVLRDKADVDKELRRHLPHALMELIKIMDFPYQDSDYKKLAGKAFQVILISDDPRNIPFFAIKETTGLRQTVLYIRRLASTEEATYEEFQIVVNRRIDTNSSNQNLIDLPKHMDDLRILYLQQDRYFQQNPMGSLVSRLSVGRLYQRESFEEFTNRMIETKQRLIERILRR